MTTPLTVGEKIGRSVRDHPELKQEPRKLSTYLTEKHDLLDRDAVEIALRIANEPGWTTFPPLAQMELILTQHCNLKCDYCFVGEQSEKRMSEESGRKAIKFLLNSSGSMESVSITFFGGEPLLAFKLMKKLVLYGERIARSKKKTIRWRMTTNGTLVDKKSLSFFQEHQVIYLLSIDGDRKTQDTHRQTKTSGSSYDMLNENFALMKKYQPWMGARITLMPDTVHSLLGNVKLLVKKGMNQFIIEPAEGVEWSEQSKELYVQQMTKLAEYYLNNKENNKLRINLFDQLVNSEKDIASFTRGCWAGKSSVAVAPDGSIYPCSKFIDPTSLYSAYILGHVETGITENKKRQIMVQFPVKSECHECKLVFDCSGGCPAINYLANGDQTLTCIDECERAIMKGKMEHAVEEAINLKSGKGIAAIRP